MSLSLESAGQMLSLDLVFALAVFLVALGGVIHAEGVIANSAEDAERLREMQNDLVRTSDQLVLTPGEPEGWPDTDEVKSIGLAYRDHRASNEKLLEVDSMSHRALQGNMSTWPSNVHVQLLTSSGSANCTVSGTNISGGSKPSSPLDELSIDRYVMTEDGRNCTLRVTFWRD